MLKQLLLVIVSLVFLLGSAFPILVSDDLARGRYYEIKFRLKSETKDFSRFLGLYTGGTLNADLFLYDENEKLLAKIAGSTGKYPSTFQFPKEGIYSAKVVAFSGEGNFLLLISDREELKKVLRDVK